MGNIEFTFATPDETLLSLSFCRPSAAAVADWVAELPMANTTHSARLLLDAVTEVGQWRTTPAARLDALEALRTTIHYICARLDRHAGELTALSADPDTLFAQRLQLALVAGYKATIRDLLRRRSKDFDHKLLAQSIHRALADMARVLVRACRGYTPISQGTWRELHHLYLLSEEFELTGHACDDDENHHAQLTIAEAYLRALMLAVSRPNQLRERHLTALFNALELWVPRLEFTPPSKHAMFIVDLDSDLPPRYRALGYTASAYLRGVRTDRLVLEFEAYLNELETDVPVPDYVDAQLLGRLANSWGVMKPRSFRRQGASGTLKVCAGLRATHRYLSGGVEFATQVGGASALVLPEIDPFRNPAAADSHECFDATIADMSPIGYCLHWQAAQPVPLLTGDLLALRETEDRRWSVGICRWIEHRDSGSQTGVELLSPRAIPVAIRRIEKRSGSLAYSRALLLPALEALRQQATLIVPSGRFAELQKVQVQRQGIRTTAQLLRCVQMTESLMQFTFRMLDGYLENLPSDLNMEGVWDSMGTEDFRASR